MSVTEVWTVPNVLSLSRIPLAALVLVTVDPHYMVTAAALYLLALVTNVLDGAIARIYPHTATDLGKNVLQPACDFVLAGAAVIGLIRADVWPWQVGVLLLVVAGVLQLISWFANAGPVMRVLKRHQYYIHPLFSVAVMVMAGQWYVVVAANGHAVSQTVLLFCYNFVVGFLIYMRRHWLAKLLAGPE